ncbi:MAG TPA: TetR/AcrR family transcriptional regulator [Actinoplanes sp.]|nr:TetR/AcrR family transcriptional regulator [Actinoplanes sp.]
MADPKPDRRVRRTRAAIQAALLQLMRAKGYDAVTVTDIIETADVGRSTFYAHFTDKQDVLEDSLHGLGMFLRAQRDASPGRLFGFSLAMFEHVREEQELVRAMLGRRGGAAVHDQVNRLLTELVTEDLTALGADRRSPVPLDLTVAAVVAAYLALLGHWVDGAEPRSAVEMDAAFRRLVLPGIAPDGAAAGSDGAGAKPADVRARPDGAAARPADARARPAGAAAVTPDRAAAAGVAPATAAARTQRVRADQ